jgi:hypothetical protein
MCKAIAKFRVGMAEEIPQVFSTKILLDGSKEKLILALHLARPPEDHE